MSKKTKFTKGEWLAFMPNDDWDFNNGDDEIVIGMGSFLVDPNYYTAIHKVTIEGFSDDSNNADEAKANAHLISAAPEMYDLLITIENDSDQVPAWLWNKIQLTLKKARGE